MLSIILDIVVIGLFHYMSVGDMFESIAEDACYEIRPAAFGLKCLILCKISVILAVFRFVESHPDRSD